MASRGGSHVCMYVYMVFFFFFFFDICNYNLLIPHRRNLAICAKSRRNRGKYFTYCIVLYLGPCLIHLFEMLALY